MTFWLVDSSKNPISKVTTVGTNPLLSVDTATRNISVLATNGLANVGTYRIGYKVSLKDYPAVQSDMSDPFKLEIVDPCPTTTLVLNSPFVDTTYELGDPQKYVTWSDDADLGIVSISPKTCGSFLITFWLLDNNLTPIKDVTKSKNPTLTVD